MISDVETIDMLLHIIDRKVIDLHCLIRAPQTLKESTPYVDELREWPDSIPKKSNIHDFSLQML